MTMRTHAVVGLATLVAAAAHAADCPEPVSMQAVHDRLDDASTAYARLDVPGFDAALDDVAFALPCLAEAAVPEFAGRLHRFQGLRQFVAREDERASQAFAAARSADGADLPGDLVPEGHAARDLYGRIPLDNAVYEPIPEPKRGWVSVDGTKSTERPADWPALVQVHDTEGAVLVTAYLFPGEPMPEYDAWPVPTAPLRTPRKPPPIPLIAGTAAAAVAAGALYGAAGISAARFEADHPGWTDDDLLAQQRRTNSLVVASAATAGAAAIGVGLSLGVRW